MDKLTESRVSYGKREQIKFDIGGLSLNTFGSWLRTMRNRAVRGDHTMTQEEFASELKLHYVKRVKEGDYEDDKVFSKSAVSTWESGGKNAPLQDNEFVEAVARVFGVTTADVLRGSGYDLGPAYESELDEQRRILLEAYDSGNLERMVRIALEAHAKQHSDYSRLASNDSGEATTGSEATTSGRR